MKSLLVAARIIIVGCLWSIVFIEGIRVIMLCNWRFDIFWPDHWAQAKALWDAGWVMKAPKEWAFVIILFTFFPMLITGWWTLSLVAWEEIIWDLIMLPRSLYRRYIKAPINVMTTNNKYGVVKKKSYKQIRPAGVNGIRTPISDYNDSSSKPIPSAARVAPAPLMARPAQPFSAPTPAVVSAPTPKKTSIQETIDHALFKFDDDDDDFDLDIDSFEKTNVSQNKPAKQNKKPVVDDDDDDYSSNSYRRFEHEENDDDDFYEQPKSQKKNNDNNRKKAPKPSIVDDFSDDEDEDIQDNKRKNQKKSEDKKQKNNKNEKRNKDNSQDNNRNDNKQDNRANKERGDDRQSDNASKGPVFDALKQKGYDVISNVSVKNTVIDFVGVSESAICLCLVDKENGDWLADEELFNGEEPLWFSENSHRISPVRQLDMARKLIKDKIDDDGFEQELKSFVVIQMANIINADDMFDIWSDMDIEVTRINRGSPKDIKLFSKTLEEADGSANKNEIDRLKKLFKSLK